LDVSKLVLLLLVSVQAEESHHCHLLSIDSVFEKPIKGLSFLTGFCFCILELETETEETLEICKEDN
jgi:hypothetical protein